MADRDKIKSVLASYLKGEITSIDEAVEQVIGCMPHANAAQPIELDDAAFWAGAEQANKLFGQFMPTAWLQLFKDSYNDIALCRANSPAPADETRGGTGDDCSVGKRGAWPPQCGESSTRELNDISSEQVVTAGETAHFSPSSGESAAAPASASVEAVAAVLKGWLGDYMESVPPLGKISKTLAAAALGSGQDHGADAADAATLRVFIKEHGMTPSMMASQVETLRAQVDRMRAALKWYAEHAAGCRKITSEGDTSRRALDADGGKIARDALSGLAAPTHDDQAAAQHEIMMRVFDWAYLHATEGMAWPDKCTAERAIELAKDRAPTQADADTINETSQFPEARAIERKKVVS